MTLWTNQGRTTDTAKTRTNAIWRNARGTRVPYWRPQHRFWWKPQLHVVNGRNSNFGRSQVLKALGRLHIFGKTIYWRIFVETDNGNSTSILFHSPSHSQEMFDSIKLYCYTREILIYLADLIWPLVSDVGISKRCFDVPLDARLKIEIAPRSLHTDKTYMWHWAVSLT